MPRRFSYVWLLALLAVSCGKEPSVSPGGNEWTPLELPVQIATRVQEPETKAPVGDSFANGDKIGVFGFYHDDCTWDSEFSNIPDYMYNQLMTYNATTLAWEYSPVKYWPNETGSSLSTGTDLLSFWGYHPHNGSLPDGVTLNPVKSNGDSYTSASTGLPNIAFTQSTTTAGDSQVDLMVSDLVKDQAKPALDGKVTLPFKHVLARVSVFAKVKEGYGQDITVTSITIGALNTVGTWNTSPTATDGNWSGLGTPGTFTVVDSDTVLDKDETQAAPMGIILPIPQGLAGVNLHLEYSVADVPQEPCNFTLLDAHEGDATFSGWQRGKHYVYTLVIGENAIEFSANIQEWEVVEGAYYIIG